MNIAIIIGISKYNNPDLDDLDASKNDSKIFEEILMKGTEEFKILSIYENDTESENIFKKLTSFQRQLNEEIEKNNIEKLIFYYSGHGDIYGTDNEFRYITTSYYPEKLHETTITNKEMDEILKGFKAKKTIKIVDSCHSGTRYIKNDKSQNFEIINKDFKDCYFIYSSRWSQYSKAYKNISYFSLGLFKAISSFKETDEVSLIVLIKKLKDIFVNNNEQKPYFTTQGDYDGILVTMNKELKDYLDEELKKYAYELSENIEISIDNETEDNDIKLNEIIGKIEKKYIDEEELILILREIEKQIIEYEIDKRIRQLKYEFRREFKLKEDYNEELSKEEKIANWLNENKPDYFINYSTEENSKTVYKWEKVPKVKNLLPFNLFEPNYKYKKVKSIQYYNDISGYKIKENNLPYNLIELICENNKKCFKKYISELTFAYSNKSITFFYYFSYYKLVNWNDEKKSLNFDWKIKEFNFENGKEPIVSWIKTYLDEFYDYIKTDIKESLNLDLSK